ncbi:hypothetical protein ACS0TY_015908 [Phlomoides rotata]
MMDVLGWNIFCVAIFILFLGLLGYMWLQLVEYQIAAMELNRRRGNWVYHTDGRELDRTGHVERDMEIKIVSSAPFLTRLQDIIIFVILLSLCSYPRGEYKATACKTRFPCCSFEYDSTCHYAPYFNSGTNTSSAKHVLCYQFKYVFRLHTKITTVAATSASAGTVTALRPRFAAQAAANQADQQDEAASHG